jgi:hypothetical protein
MLGGGDGAEESFFARLSLHFDAVAIDNACFVEFGSDAL